MLLISVNTFKRDSNMIFNQSWFYNQEIDRQVCHSYRILHVRLDFHSIKQVNIHYFNFYNVSYIWKA